MPFSCSLRRAVALLMLVFTLPVSAQGDSQTFGDYTVHYSVFNSTFIKPDIAQTYGLIRARDRALINVSVTRTDGDITILGLPSQIRGQASNLLQQQQQLDFKEISDGQATYYIAALRHSHEETFNITLQIQSHPDQTPWLVRFPRTLYVDGR